MSIAADPSTPDPSTPDTDARGEVVLEGRHLVKEYGVGDRRGLLRRRRTLRAVDDVSLELRRGQVTALVGQSGSGKSTLGRLLARLVPLTDGEILLHGERVAGGPGGAGGATGSGGASPREYTGQVQLTLQDPFASLNPLRRISYILGRAVRLHQDTSGADEVRERSAALLSRVGLEPAEHYLDRFPHELSGGERQRVSFARALAAGPSVLLADEPVSMLDVTIRKAMLDLIDDLRREEDLAVLYITHDLGSARRYSNEVLVMHEGRVVERGESAQVISDPQDEYTRRLLAAAPDPRRSLGTPGA
ncbi:ATP-binding cassette domain-containing protein [Brachybacterium halotolerans subsp. kimchii]|uniref:ABC transporter ATP-binding protein n=1 Tax=Brachybacterium halotolerans TaxID=2795215 RepID=UPI001E560802|nr:ATP-binding cassette domain-containing protein [Brachybacterium halotolerans]UEJ82704.1 ATP-binding cassette domain-containing protein [Brachybacterium halotolerans subsp. kimchii]